MGRAAGTEFEHYHANRGEEKLHDPYMTKKGFPEPAICPVCRSLYSKKRWVLNDEIPDPKDKNSKIAYHKCPACRKIEDGYAMGRIELSGDFVNDHKTDLLDLIKAEEKKARTKNPLERLMLAKADKNKIFVQTTTDSLAVRIGRRLTSAYKGSADIKYSEKFVDIKWNRE